MNTHYSNLEELIGGYFHQDWNTYSDTTVGVLEFYLQEWPAKYVPLVLTELRNLLQRSDAEVEAELDKMGCGYAPGGDNTTYREWLNRMESRLSQQVKANGVGSDTT